MSGLLREALLRNETLPIKMQMGNRVISAVLTWPLRS